MSGYSETTICPRCGTESLEASVDHEEVNGLCLECGYEYHTAYSVLSLEEVNEERIDCETGPLKELRPTVGSYEDGNRVEVGVSIDSKIIKAMGFSTVRKLLQGFLESNAEEFLKEQHEDQTGEWIDT